MAHATQNKARNKALFSLLLVVMALGAGCGDSFGNSIQGGIGSRLLSKIGERVEHDGIGELVERDPMTLVVYTACEGLKSADPETRCAGVQSAGIEVFFEGDSLLFDFSNAPSGGTIANGSFEGYVLTMGEHGSARRVLDAQVDEDQSTVDPDAIGIEIEDRRVAVDLRGLDYDDTMFVKVDLAFDAS